jgi:pimeloyl-ACP methyl ester carboxylesterase
VLPARPVPVTLVHGTDDDTVPLRMSQAFTAGRLVEIPGAGHYDLIDPQSPAWPQVLSVLAGTVSAAAQNRPPGSAAGGLGR